MYRVCCISLPSQTLFILSSYTQYTFNGTFEEAIHKLPRILRQVTAAWGIGGPFVMATRSARRHHKPVPGVGRPSPGVNRLPACVYHETDGGRIINSTRPASPPPHCDACLRSYRQFLVVPLNGIDPLQLVFEVNVFPKLPNHLLILPEIIVHVLEIR